MTWCPRFSLSFCANRRAVISTEPPGGNGLMMRMTRSGYLCAAAVVAIANNHSSTIERRRATYRICSAPCAGDPRYFISQISASMPPGRRAQPLGVELPHRPAGTTAMKFPRERFGYSSPFTRPPLKLPGNGRIIVWSVVNIEEWEITRPMARQLSQPPMGQTPIPDMPNWTWYEYGMRVGFWRLKRALDRARVTPTMSINAKVCEVYPEVAAAARDANWEFMAHSYVQMPIQQIEDQRAVMRKSIEVIEQFTGKKPTGWLGPGRGQTYETLDFATECGFTWFGDWVLDDQPFWVKTAHGPVLSIPYSAEINDITLMVSHHHESDVLLTRTRDAFDRLYAESAESTRILAIGVHPYVTGAAHRIKYFEELYAYINRHDVVHWTGQQIYDWYVAQAPRPGLGVSDGPVRG